MNEKEIISKIKESKIIAVLIIEHLRDVDFTIEALIRGGISIIEIALRTKNSLRILAYIVKKYPDLIVGAGTVLHNDQLIKAKDLGAHFGVSPGINKKIVVKAKEELSLPFFPGVATPTDIELALENGCHLLKFFPAEHLGGINYLKSMSSPYLHLGIKFIPLGGIKENNLSSYLSSNLVLALGGSWIANQQLIAEKNWQQIFINSRNAFKLIK